MFTAMIRRVLVAGATTALLAGGAAVVAAPAHADEHVEEPSACVSQEQYDADLAAAKEKAVAAKQAFRATLRPWGKLVREERREARGEIRLARRELRDLWRSMRGATQEERAEIREQIKAKRQEIRRDLGVLRGNRKALRTEIRAERREAFRAWQQARHDRRDARNAEVCQP